MSINYLRDFISEEVMLEISRNGEHSETEILDNETENEKAVPKCKILASHCFALLMIVMFKLSFGLNYGFTSIVIPELYKADAEIKMSLNQLTWFSSYYFMPPVGAILGGLMTQFIGCRMLLIIGGMSYITANLIFYFSTNAAMLLSAQVIVGFVDGMLKGPCLTFFAEISLPQFRTTCMSCIASGMMIGFFIESILGTYLNWRTLAPINAICPAVGVLLIYFVPETPYWLASKNRYQDAKRSLAWFRGWTTPDCVEAELRSILPNSEKTESSKNIEAHFNSRSRRKWRLKNMAKSLINRSFYIPFLTASFAFTVNNFSGVWTLNAFSVLVFDQINSPVDPYVATIIFSVMRVLGSITCMLFINLAGKRKLLFIALPTSAVVLVVAATFGFLTSTGQLSSAVYRWIPTICIFASVLIMTVGMDKIAILLNSEIFPLNLRHVGVGAGHFVNSILLSLMNKAFLYLVGAITMSGTFLFFALVNIVGLLGTYFIIPETEDKTLHEIEEHYAGIRSLKKNENK